MTTITVERLEVENDQYVWKSYEVHLKTDEDFSINDDLLDKEICRQGQLMVQYGDIMADMQAMLQRREEEVKYTYSVVATKIRSDAEKTGQKLTVDQIKEKAIQQQEYQNALFLLHKCRADALKANNWWRSIAKKADLLNALAYRQGQEIKKAY